jgi:TonB-linked SusC/RagA family outer membrane protein
MSIYVRMSLCFALIALICVVPAVGQDTGTIAGEVTEEATGEPLPGVNVVLQGTSMGTAADLQGIFRITDVPAGTYTVMATFVGYNDAMEEVVVEAGETTTVNIAMSRQREELDELVVVAYGEQRRGDVTGSIGSVEAEEVEAAAATSLQQALQGTVAGVQVTQGDAAPGAGISVQIRGITSTTGSNEPLYVVDGVPLNTSGVSGTALGASSGSGTDLALGTDTNPLATLSPSDIESIRVLKDASATALYGSRASNGVVIITTKDGGERNNVSIDYQRSFSTPVKTLNMLDAGTYARYVNEAQLNAGNGVIYGAGTEMAGDPRTPEAIADTVSSVDWQDRIFQTAVTDDLGLSFSGGDDAGSYNVRGSLLRQEGVIRGSQFVRGGIRTNLNRDITDYLRVQTRLNITRSSNNMVRTSSGNNGDTGGIVRAAQQYQPLRPFIRNRSTLGDPRAAFEQNRFPDRFGANPVRYTDEVTLDQDITRGIGNLKTLVDLTGSLTLDLSVGANYQDKRFRTYYPSTVGEGEQFNGVASLGKSDFLQLVTENLLRFSQSFGDHSIDALVGGSYETNESEYTKSESQDFPDDEIGRFLLSAGRITLAPQGNFQEWRLLSGLSRIQYSYADRYNLTISFRADGSSKFARNNKWAYFPSVGASWRITNEPFLDGTDWLSNAKLRASWGQTGNQGIGPYGSKARLTLGSVTFNNEVIPSAFAPPFNGLPNPDLKWETTTQYNLGVDLSFLENRLRVTTDVYQKNTDDLLQTIQLATNTGFSQAIINSGSVRNQGIELQIGGDVLTGDVTWRVSANASRNVNEITDLPVEEQFAQRLGSGRINFQPFIQREGLPIGALYGYETAGVYRSSEQIQSDPAVTWVEDGGDTEVGDIRIRDLATTCTSQLVSEGVCSEGQRRVMGRSDGQIDSSDRTVIGDTNPDLLLGLTNTFQFGDFSLRFLIDSKLGGDIVNAQRIRTLRLDGEGNIPEEVYANAFRPEETYGEAANPDGKYPMPDADRGTYGQFLDLFVEDGSYVRLKNFQLGYTLDGDLIPYASEARLYIRGTNLFTITDYSGYSPEVSAFNEAQRQGVDLGSYPQNRTFGVGIDLTF